MRQLTALATLVTALLLGGCITSYSGVDTGKQRPAPTARSADSLRYSIYGNSLLNGRIAVREVLDHEAPFARKEQIATPAQADGTVAPAAIPAQGPYVKVTIENMPPSIPAGIAAYVSWSTLFILPFWSTEDGARLLFDIYRDGSHQQRFEYVLNRHTYGWAPLLLLVWVNGLTAGESDVFRAATRQFLEDAASLLLPG